MSDDELQISLDEFREKCSDPMGYPEYVILEAEICVAAAFSDGTPDASQIVSTDTSCLD